MYEVYLVDKGQKMPVQVNMPKVKDAEKVFLKAVRSTAGTLAALPIPGPVDIVLARDGAVKRRIKVSSFFE